MTAKTMFKKLNFNLFVDNVNDNIIYRNEKGEGYHEIIVFYKDKKEISLRCVDDTFEINVDGFTFKPESKNFVMTYDLLQAINQQCKELGWI